MNRRSFMKFLPVLPVLAIAKAKAEEDPTSKDGSVHFVVGNNGDYPRAETRVVISDEGLFVFEDTGWRKL